MPTPAQDGIAAQAGATIVGLLAAIPDPDNASHPGIANLDEMFPSTASQLRVELEAIQAAQSQGTGNGVLASGVYTVIAGDDSAGASLIVTGLADLVLANRVAVTVWRAGTMIPVPAAALTEPTAGTISVADSGALAVTTGDLIVWVVLAA